MPRILLLLMVFVATAGPVLARPLDEVTDSGTLSVFVYSDYAPYSWQTGDDYHGIDVDIARAFGAELGVEVDFLMRGADENFDDDLRVNIWKGDLVGRRVADVMMHAPYDRAVDVRNELAVLMAPYFQEQMSVVYNTDRIDQVKTFGRFVSTPIGVEIDTAGDFFLSGAFQGRIRHSVRRSRSFALAVEQFRQGNTDALFGSRAQTEWVSGLVDEFDTAVAQPPMPGIVRRGWPIGIAVRQDSRDLGYALGDVISRLTESGELQRIMAAYGVTWIPPALE